MRQRFAFDVERTGAGIMLHEADPHRGWRVALETEGGGGRGWDPRV